MQQSELHKRRALTLGSGCQLAFIKHSELTNIIENGVTHQQVVNTIKPILVLTGINNQGQDGTRVSSQAAAGCVGIITSELNKNSQIIETKFLQNEIVLNKKSNSNEQQDWLTLDPEMDQIVYPRIFINSLQVKTDSNSLVVKYEDYNNTDENRAINYKNLQPYEDYSILTRSLQKKYAITLKPELVLRQGIEGSYSGIMQPRTVIISYAISNAVTSIYLDALEVAKQNSMPKVSYDVKCNIFNSKTCETIYNKIGNIVRINDNDLKFKNVRGYISGFSLDLDNPDNDNIEIKNYKTKFEDLFSTITAQTEQMKKNNNLIEAVSSAFTSTGDLTQETLQSSIMKVDLDYAFNNGKLTIDEHNGIWGTSDTGVVAFRGGGIFTSTEKDAEGNWKWNSGITPEGINASLISTGQLDTNLIKIYSGDNLRFQMNGDGIFAYKSIMSDSAPGQRHPAANNSDTQVVSAQASLDGKQYVLFNDEGLSLIAKKGAKVLDATKSNYKIVLSDSDIDQIGKINATKASNLRRLEQIKRVEVSWEGFVLRNWQNDKVFYADPDTGNLIISGTINATSGHIGAWNFNQHRLWAETDVTESIDGEETIYHTYVALNSGGIKQQKIGTQTIDTTPYAFWAGNADPLQAGFYIRKDGQIKAASGTIGGWTIASNKLSSNVISLASNTSDFDIDDKGYSINADTNASNEVNNGSVTQHAALWVHGTNSKNATNALLYISSDGNLYAKQLYFLYHNINGVVSYSNSVKTLIDNAQTKADNAWTKAKTAETAANNAKTAAQQAQNAVNNINVPSSFSLGYNPSTKYLTFSWYDGSYTHTIGTTIS